MPTYSSKTILLATDQQDSVLAASRANATAYTPYGHTLLSGLPNLLGFNGELIDRFTGQYHLGNGYREFNPVLMRFNKPDTWSPFNKGGLNTYAYCAGDPINKSDPSGKVPIPNLIGVTAKMLIGGTAVGAGIGLIVYAQSKETTLNFALTAVGALAITIGLVPLASLSRQATKRLKNPPPPSYRSALSMPSPRGNELPRRSSSTVEMDALSINRSSADEGLPSYEQAVGGLNLSGPNHTQRTLNSQAITLASVRRNDPTRAAPRSSIRT